MASAWRPRLSRAGLAPGFAGSTGQGLIHLIGHSHGSKVPTVAALNLQKANVPEWRRLTTRQPRGGSLHPDRRLFGTVGIHLAGFADAENYLWYYLAQMNLSRTPVTNRVDTNNTTFVDNYYSTQGVGVAGLGGLNVSALRHSFTNPSSVVDTQLNPQTLYGQISSSNAFGAIDTLLLTWLSTGVV